MKAESAEVEFCAVSIGSRVAVADDGAEYPIVNMFDDMGDETDDEDEVVTLVVEMSPELFAVIDMGEFIDELVN